ncbi:MAG: cupin domain-containing protein [Alphaproteobacteria bacterium]
MAKRIDVSELEALIGTNYPAPFSQPCVTRERKRLGDAAGLTQYGVNLLRLPPGAWSSQRHWHTHEDEFVYILSGDVTMVSNDGEEILRAGDAAGFRAGAGDGHCLQNRSNADVLVLEIGARNLEDSVDYPDIDIDIDMARPAGSGQTATYQRRDGTLYPSEG